MADYTVKAQFFVAFRCPADQEAEGDRVFADHLAWMERTHPKEGDEALLQYTVSKNYDDEGNVQSLLAEVYETTAGVENHSRLAHEDEEDSGVQFCWRSPTSARPSGGAPRTWCIHSGRSCDRPRSVLLHESLLDDSPRPDEPGGSQPSP